jgi:hypothetical protein
VGKKEMRYRNSSADRSPSRGRNTLTCRGAYIALISSPSDPSGIFMRHSPILHPTGRELSTVAVVERQMLAPLLRYSDADLCQGKIDDASCPSKELFVAAATHVLNGAGCSQSVATLLSRLIDAEAWLDAAVFIGEQLAPKWRMRRLVLDDGHWLCSLSMHPSLPVELDDTVEASHDSAPLAILSAVLCVAQRSHQPSSDDTQPQATPSSTSGIAMCCENYS